MEKLCAIKDIAREHRVPSVKMGVYNILVYTCPECLRNVERIGAIVGFAMAPFPDRISGNTLACVYECPACGTRWWTHAYCSTYAAWKEAQTQKEETQNESEKRT